MNKAYSKVFNDQKHKEISAPDIFTWEPNEDLNVPENLVLCRDENGVPTAVYGAAKWDFAPYRLSVVREQVFHFRLSDDEHQSDEEVELIVELKRLLFCIMYFAESGKAGSLATGTLESYFTVLRMAARFCLSMGKRELVGVLSMKELFTNKAYLQAFVRISDGVTFNKKTKAILGHLVRIGEKRIGFIPVAKTDIKFGSTDSKQTPVIPTRIYLAFMNQLAEELLFIEGQLDHLTSFIGCLNDEFYGVSKKTQKRSGVGGAKHYRPDWNEAVEIHGVGELFDKYGGLGMNYVPYVIHQIQYICKLALHLYTGMRDEEVNRLPFNCIYEEVVTGSIADENGVEVDTARTVQLLSTDAEMVEMLSTTTKFEGYKKSASWYAAEEAVRAIRVLQTICRAIAVRNELEAKDCPLLLNAAMATSKRKLKVGVAPSLKDKRREPDWMKSLVITENDLIELQASDEERDFKVEDAFAVGQPWPFRTHQFRRSLAFYASNSGFVSLPSLKRQFKHMTIEMSRYYQRNFENIKTIFGYYDAEKREYVLPDEHFLFDFQMGIPANVAYDIMTEVLGKEAPLFGKTGSYIERQRAKVKEGEIDIKELRKDTEKRVEKGELVYKKTLLGGCTKIGPCDSFMLGDFIECVDCEGAIIDGGKVDLAISEMEHELSLYEPGTCEYKLAQADLDRLSKFKTHSIEREQVIDVEVL